MNYDQPDTATEVGIEVGPVGDLTIGQMALRRLVEDHGYWIFGSRTKIETERDHGRFNLYNHKTKQYPLGDDYSASLADIARFFAPEIEIFQAEEAEHTRLIKALKKKLRDQNRRTEELRRKISAAIVKGQLISVNDVESLLNSQKLSAVVAGIFCDLTSRPEKFGNDLIKAIFGSAKIPREALQNA